MSRSSSRPPSGDPPADPYEVARSAALDRLTDCDRSRADLERHLAKRGVEPEVARAVLDRLEEVGLVDDERFASAWVESRQRGKGLSRRALSAELRRKGIDPDVAGPALDQVDADAEREAARQLVRARLRRLRGVDAQAQARRLVSMLARKGYGSQLAYDVVRAELADADAVGHIDSI